MRMLGLGSELGGFGTGVRAHIRHDLLDLFQVPGGWMLGAGTW